MIRGFAVLTAALFVYLVMLAGTLNSTDFVGGPNTDTPSGQATPTVTPTCVSAPGPWVLHAPLPYQARGVALASDGRYIYANGGFALTNTLQYYNETNRYDPVAALWVPFAPSPDAHYMAPAVYGGGGKIYVLGGDTDSGLSSANRIYDIASDTWSSGAPLPVALSEQAAGFFNGKIYMAGGNDGTISGSHLAWSYNIATDSWTSLADMPRARIGSGFGVIDGKLYLAGGAGMGADTNTLFAYDIASNSWTQLADLPLGVNYPGSGVVSGKLWVFGGQTPEPTNTTQIYDPTTSSWSSGPPLNVTRAVFYGATVGTDIAAIGGGTGPGLELDTNEISSNPPGPCVTITPSPSPSPGALTATPTPTATPMSASPSPTSIPPTVTNTLIPTNTTTQTLPPSTATATNTPRLAYTPTVTATPCSVAFSDVHPTDYFYQPVLYLACHGVVTGYADGTFRPYANTTRGQLSKIVVLANGWSIDTTGGPHFSDVPQSNPFYGHIETAYNHGIISGYSDGTFKWGNNVTRGQLCKIVVGAQGWPINTTGGPHFSDVPVGDPFYGYIETAYNHYIISGYSDGTFHPGNNATRGQISKIVYEAISVH